MFFKKLEILTLVYFIIINEHQSTQADNSQESKPKSEDKLPNKADQEKIKAENLKVDIKKLFKKIDQNDDEEVDKQELCNRIINVIKNVHKMSAAELFEKIDTDKDQKVSYNEYTMHEHHETAVSMDILIHADNSPETLKLKTKVEHKKNVFNAADIDGDMRLNLDEYLSFLFPIFFPHLANIVVNDYMNNFDSNKDKLVDKEEYLKLFVKHDLSNEQTRDAAMKKIETYFVKYDKNNDGKINFEEYYEQIKPGYEKQAMNEVENLFKQSDSDKDGMLELHDFEKHAVSWSQALFIENDTEEDYVEPTKHVKAEL